VSEIKRKHDPARQPPQVLRPVVSFFAEPFFLEDFLFFDCAEI
jgi:hypothetical protein